MLKKNKEFCCIISILLLCTTFSFAQENSPDDNLNSDAQRNNLYAGINIGGLLANRYTAPYYNGIGNGSYTVIDLLNNTQIYNQIYNQYGQDFELGELPAKPRYRVGLNLGANVGVYLNESTALFTNFDFARLSLVEAMTIYTNNPTNPSGDKIIHVESITGKEQRLSIDLGLHLDYGVNEQAMGYIEIAGNFNAVKALKNEVHFGNLTYNLIIPPIPTGGNRVNVTTGGIGYGVMLGTGYRLRFNNLISFDIGTSLYYQKINLFQDQRFKINPVVYVRIVYI